MDFTDKDLIKKIGGYSFLHNSYSRSRNEPYKVLLLDKKSQYKSGLEYAVEKGIDQIEINIDLNEKDLELLNELPLKTLHLRGIKNNINLSWINNFKNLEYLGIGFSGNGELDLRSLPKLHTLNVTAGIKILNINQSPSLKDIFIYNYKESSLPYFGSVGIEKIHIYNSSVESLDSLKNCNSIKYLVVENCLNLHSINGLQASAKAIQELALRNCKSFSDYSIVKNFNNLREIYFLNCGDITNVSIFENMKKLRYGKIDINIEDGNVDMLMKMPIIFANYKHFNCKNNLKVKIVTGEGNYLSRGHELLYKLGGD